MYSYIVSAFINDPSCMSCPSAD